MTACDGDFEFRGTIQTLPGTSGFIGDWNISGRTVHVGTSTKIEQEDGQIAVGATVEVEGCLQTDGSIIAKEIEIKSGPGGGSNYSFTGIIEELPNMTGRFGDWKVSGTVVHVGATTCIKQEKAIIAVGVNVEVEGARRPDGSVDAYKIEVKSEMDDGGETEFKGSIESLPSASGRLGQWSVSGRIVNVTSGTRLKPDSSAVAIGFYVQVKGTIRQDGQTTLIDATEIQVKSNSAGNGGFAEFYGSVEVLPGTPGQTGTWTVSGRKVNVTANTKIKPEATQLVVGSTVEIKGALSADGSINAVKIEVKDRTGLSEFKGKVESLPVAGNLIGDWRVSGVTIHVDVSTQIERKYGTISIGAFVEVYGLLQTDGSINAAKIETKQGPAGGAFMSYNSATTVSAASYLEDNAPGSIVSAFGSGMSTVTTAATSLPLPMNLGNVSVLVDGKQARLFFVSPNQINYQIPLDLASGAANVVITSNGQAVSQGTVPVSTVALNMFTADSSGQGAPAGLLLRIKAGGEQVYESLVRFDAVQNKFVPAPIVRRAGEQLFLVLYGTGLKLATNSDGNPANGVAENVLVTIGGLNSQVLYAGEAPGYVGLDQINIRIPDNLVVNPNTTVVIRARDLLNNWKQANPVTISVN